MSKAKQFFLFFPESCSFPSLPAVQAKSWKTSMNHPFLHPLYPNLQQVLPKVLWNTCEISFHLPSFEPAPSLLEPGFPGPLQTIKTVNHSSLGGSGGGALNYDAGSHMTKVGLDYWPGWPETWQSSECPCANPDKQWPMWRTSWDEGTLLRGPIFPPLLACVCMHALYNE